MNRFQRIPPTDPFTILEFQNPSKDVPEVHKIRQSPDREALKLWKDRSGPHVFERGRPFSQCERIKINLSKFLSDIKLVDVRISRIWKCEIIGPEAGGFMSDLRSVGYLTPQPNVSQF